MIKKRFFTIDFLRGISIFLMIVLHIISDTLDIDSLVAKLDQLPLFQVLLLVVLPFLGGLAGLFLIISAIGNMISMQRQLARGDNWKQIMLRQVITGSFLLFFAMLSESILGYHGTIGEVFLHLNNLKAGTYDQALWRFLFFETVHTIAWCIIINGIVHALLIRNEKWRKPSTLIIFYSLFAVLALAFTPLMWFISDKLVPGYPYAIDPATGKNVEFGVIGITSFGQFVLRFFLGPLAAMWEPVFPYLTASFAGSIFGIYISQKEEKIKLSFLKKFFFISIAMFVIGIIGVFLNVFLVINNQGMDAGLNLYLHISEHRYWTTENGVPVVGWLFQFLSLNGFSFCLISVMFRIVEFRGKGAIFANHTKFIRRLGFIPFTIYNMQYFYNLFYFIVSLVMTDTYVRLPWSGTIIVIILSLAFYHVLTYFWEKIGYFGSMKWIIVFLRNLFIKEPKQETEKRWWKKDILNVQGNFYNVDWVDLNRNNREKHTESSFALKLSKIGLFIFPFSLISYFISKEAQKTEMKNGINKKALILSIIGSVWSIVFFVFLFSVKLSTFGIRL
ncbi:MAG: hypothetical protein K9W46_02670 [Candidatus Heimdallarchaeum endolithica]|uniref:Heparan-alpha-glucosaminide N-acetyltransferase catalytic domain-containing protein n=1 Tax=Candidatus Heimdallarchaeum endolithica TaxID=2876572 RepID=A0A9Y1BRX0_9ARCH|nr:MAG: hypothetical protein K9W46_02670 [Candidatus Heimdallarchaeum endolithica]